MEIPKAVLDGLSSTNKENLEKWVAELNKFTEEEGFEVKYDWDDSDGKEYGEFMSVTFPITPLTEEDLFGVMYFCLGNKAKISCNKATVSHHKNEVTEQSEIILRVVFGNQEDFTWEDGLNLLRDHLKKLKDLKIPAFPA